MYVCMNICMYVCMYACMHVHMYACMHVCMNIIWAFSTYMCSRWLKMAIWQTYNNILQYSERYRKLLFTHPSRQTMRERNKGKKWAGKHQSPGIHNILCTVGTPAVCANQWKDKHGRRVPYNHSSFTQEFNTTSITWKYPI